MRAKEIISKIIDVIIVFCSIPIIAIAFYCENSRSRCEKPRGVGGKGARAMKTHMAERDCTVVDDDSPPTSLSPPISQGLPLWRWRE